MRLRTRLPEDHLNEDARQTVNLAIGLVATMTALILGLVTASAKSGFDAEDAALKQTAAGLLSVDRALARYGPETNEMRQALRQAVAHRIETIWHAKRPRDTAFDPSSTERGVELLAAQVRHLAPKTDDQR